MANEIVKKAQALPASLVSKIAEGIGRAQVATGGSNRGQSLLRLVTGKWLFGQGNDQVQDGSSWLADIGSLKYGDCTWHESQLVDEWMTEMWLEKRPLPGTHPTGAVPKSQASVELTCLNGEDAGMRVLYKTSSLGGTDAMQDLKDAVARRVETYGAEHPYLFPVLQLGSTSYPNKRYGGTTYNPVLERVGWADVNGNLEDSEADAPPVKEPVRPTPSKPSLKAVPDEPQAATGQRRRPR
jgi:hypothetical protein